MNILMNALGAVTGVAAIACTGLAGYVATRVGVSCWWGVAGTLVIAAVMIPIVAMCVIEIVEEVRQ